MKGNQFKRFILEKIPTVTWILIVMMFYFSMSSSNFLTLANAANLCRQGAILLILCLGVIVVKITGGIARLDDDHWAKLVGVPRTRLLNFLNALIYQLP